MDNGRRQAVQRTRGRRTVAFTLVELLVVVGIIGILVAILLPAVGKVQQAGRKTEARAQMRGLETAIKAYLNEYSRFPLQDASSGDHDYNDDNDADDLLTALLGTDDSLNPREITFLQIDTNQIGKAGTTYEGDYLDPWDMPYQVVADWDFDGTVDTDSEHGEIKGQVAVWSFGPDTEERASDESEEESDDILGWKRGS
jgi:prepilin-type N-terminal cleavage/methylation domain-containing protein